MRYRLAIRLDGEGREEFNVAEACFRAAIESTIGIDVRRHPSKGLEVFGVDDHEQATRVATAVEAETSRRMKSLGCRRTLHVAAVAAP